MRDVLIQRVKLHGKYMKHLKNRIERILSFLLNQFKRKENNRNDYIVHTITNIYKAEGVDHYKLQNLATRIIKNLTLQEIVSNPEILNGLHPMQGCLIGIEYAKILRIGGMNQGMNEKRHEKFTSPVHRYGNNKVLYQDRKGLVGFECRENKQQFLMDPREIALSRKLIEEFDVSQSFYIGLWAGIKLLKQLKDGSLDCNNASSNLES